MAQKATSMSISLPRELKDYVKKQAQREHYGTPSDYVRGLIREDLKRVEQEKLENMLLEGLASGESKPMTKKDWQQLRDDVRQQVAKRKNKK